MRTYRGRITKLEDNQVFVFGANTQFRHGKGAALQAVKFGAIYGKGGFVGKTWSIVTKDLTKRNHPSISKQHIIDQISKLYKFSRDNPDKEFLVAYSGTGVNLNGYSNQQMADMFSSEDIPDNIVFEEEFSKLL
jgi:hypothetical protein